MSSRSTSLKPVEADVSKRHPSVPDVRGDGPHAPDQPEYQPPKEHLGVNPTGAAIPEPTPTAQADRSVPDAPVVGELPREPVPHGTESAQLTARERGAAWPPAEAEPRAATA